MGAVLVAAVLLIVYLALRVHALSAEVTLFGEVRRQEIDYVQATAKRTFTLEPTKGMVFYAFGKSGDLVPEPAEKLILAFDMHRLDTVSSAATLRGERWVSECSYYDGGGPLGVVNISGMEWPKGWRPGECGSLIVAWELMKQIIAQDKGWFAESTFRDAWRDVPIVYARHPAGILALIAYADRKNPDRVLVEYLFAFSSCPTRNTGDLTLRRDPAFFRPVGAGPPRK
jgi:hypothetical protein